MDTHTDTRSAPSIADTTNDHTDDLVAIRALVGDVEAGFNANDADLIVRPFAENAASVGVNGALIEGRSAALEASRELLTGPLRDQRARYQLAEVTFLRPDVAIGHKLAWALDEDDRPTDVGHAMIALYLFVKEGGRWWVASRQNTMVT